MMAAVMTLAALMLGMFLVRSPASSVGVATHLALTLPQGLSFDVRETRPVMVISPAGDEVVFVATDGETRRLYRRSLKSLDAVALEGTDGAKAPFYSPDGLWVGFAAADNRMKKVSLESGQVVTLTDGSWGAGSWGEDGSIIYTPNYLEGLWRVAASGGAAEELTHPDPAVGELNHSWPDHIPESDALVFTSFRLPLAESRIELFDTATGERRLLIENGVFGRFVASGHLLFVRENVVLAAPFDPRKLELTGPPVPVLEDAFVAPYEGNSQFAVSDTGTLIHAPASLLSPPRRIVWVDRQGREEVLLEADRRYSNPEPVAGREIHRAHDRRRQSRYLGLSNGSQGVEPVDLFPAQRAHSDLVPRRAAKSPSCSTRRHSICTQRQPTVPRNPPRSSKAQSTATRRRSRRTGGGWWCARAQRVTTVSGSWNSEVNLWCGRSARLDSLNDLPPCRRTDDTSPTNPMSRAGRRSTSSPFPIPASASR